MQKPIGSQYPSGTHERVYQDSSMYREVYYMLYREEYIYDRKPACANTHTGTGGDSLS